MRTNEYIPFSKLDDDVLLDTLALCQWLGVARNTPFVWHTRGVGPKRVKIGRSVKFRVGDVRRWLADNDSRLRVTRPRPTEDRP